MAIAEESVYAALRQVNDPEMFVNIIDLGLVYEVNVEETDDGKSKIHVKMTMTSPACPAAPEILQEARDVLIRLDGVSEANIELVMTPPWTPDRMTEEARDELGFY
jgi:metal-sulfur cluster biosynthetic enzyme